MKKSRWLRICSLSLAVFLTACLCVVPAAAALREGDRGNEVRKVQEKLKEKAFEEFLQELNAQEMKEIDEVVSFNYNNREEDV